MKTGLKSLENNGTCSDELFDALKEMAQARVDIPIKSGKLLV